jgi:uncharacterized SAM-binding protein YcdF (DUF218 family)
MYELINTVGQPYALVFLALAVSIICLWRKCRHLRKTLLLLTAAYVSLTLMSTPAVAYLAASSLEWQVAGVEEMPSDMQAIVVLASSVSSPDDSRERAELDHDSMQRCLHAANLYHQRPGCSVFVSGGKVNPETPGPVCALVMFDFLVRLGVKAPDIVVEDRSRTTYENAVETTKLLRQRQVTKAVLVTDAVDMFRALRCFQKQGWELTASPCHYRAGAFELGLDTFVPNPLAVRDCQRVWHEWLGTAWYWLKGRI